MASAISSCKDLLERISPGSPRSSVKDLYGIAQGPLREDFPRISTRSSHKDLCKIVHFPLHGIFTTYGPIPQRLHFETREHWGAGGHLQSIMVQKSRKDIRNLRRQRELGSISHIQPYKDVWVRIIQHHGPVSEPFHNQLLARFCKSMRQARFNLRTEKIVNTPNATLRTQKIASCSRCGHSATKKHSDGPAPHLQTK